MGKRRKYKWYEERKRILRRKEIWWKDKGMKGNMKKFKKDMKWRREKK